MHDIRTIRDNPAAFDEGLARRGLSAMSSSVLALDEARRALIHQAETAQAEANKAAKEVGAAKARGDEAEFKRLRAAVAENKARIAELQEEAKAKDAELRALMLGIPNIPYDDVPSGEDEDDNVEIHRHGNPRNFAFQPVEHFEIPAVRDQLDFEAGARLSGSRFVVIKGAAARLHRALAQFMIDLHTEEHGLVETQTPVLVREEMMVGTGQLPKFSEDLFHLDSDSDFFLIPTAEVPVTNLVADQILAEADLPLRFVAHTPCFRSEAGNYGRDTRGIIRQHQFEKVELVHVVHPERSWEAFEELVGHAEKILQMLELPYRAVNLCGGDLGFAAARTTDLEVWLPSQGTYREISSCSNFLDFQARRMQARYRPSGGGKPALVHTLNGSGLAIGRTLVAVLENYQDGEGRIHVPDVLRPLMGGASVIETGG